MVLQDKYYIEIRQKFINNFLDKDSDETHKEYFNNRILRSVDGLFHTGYFWDLFKNPKIVEEKLIYDFLNYLSSDIYVLWDNNIYIKDLKYPFFSVLKIQANKVEEILPTLPIDFYLFDETYSRVFAFTHENLGEKRYCLTVNR